MTRLIIGKPIKTERLSDIIETHVRRLVLDGDIKPGERLPTEKEIGKQFGVSITTAREALKGLEVRGLIERRKGKGGGVFGRTPGRESVKNSLHNFLSLKKISSHHLTELRLMLEPTTARIAAGSITKQQIKALEKNVKYCIEKSHREFVDDRKRENIEFHLLIAEATKNPVLVLTIDYVMDFLFESKIKAFQPEADFTAEVINDHRNILIALKERDGEAAERQMIIHLQKIERYFVEKHI